MEQLSEDLDNNCHLLDTCLLNTPDFQDTCMWTQILDLSVYPGGVGGSHAMRVKSEQMSLESFAEDRE